VGKLHHAEPTRGRKKKNDTAGETITDILWTTRVDEGREGRLKTADVFEYYGNQHGEKLTVTGLFGRMSPLTG